MWVRLVLCEQEREVKGMGCWEALDLGVSQGSSVPPSLSEISGDKYILCSDRSTLQS